MSENYNDLLGGRVTPSLTFTGQFPVTYTGLRLIEAAKRPAYEYDPSKPGNRGAQKFWPDGNPVENLWLTVQTDLRDPNVQNDDGRRVLVLDSKNKLEAVQAAVRESGADFAPNGTLDIEWYGNDPNGKNPQNPPKLYRARWAGPTYNDAIGAGWGQAQPAPQAPAQGGWGAPPTPAASAPQANWGGQAQPASPAPATGGWGNPAPAAGQGGWGAPPAPAPEPDPTTYDEFVAAFRRKGVDPSTITSPEQAAQVWALVKNNPNVA